MTALVLAQEEAISVAFGLIVFLIFMVPVVLLIVSYWMILSKAGEPGWKALVPFYNGWVYARVVGRPGWWGLLLYVPIVNLVMGAIMGMDLATSFGKDNAFGLGLALSAVIGFLGLIFYPILAFGDARYLGPGGPEPRPGWPRVGQIGAGHASPYGVAQGGYQPPPGQQWGPPAVDPQSAPDWGPPSVDRRPPQSGPPTW